jgi:hypothetical protein
MDSREHLAQALQLLVEDRSPRFYTRFLTNGDLAKLSLAQDLRGSRAWRVEVPYRRIERRIKQGLRPEKDADPTLI